MKIILSKRMGFCFGVKKSVKLAKNALKARKNNLYMLGSIINNPQVIEYFIKKGVKIADTLDEVPEEGTVITRAHGISPTMLKKAYQKKLSVVDTTCPYVRKVQKIARYLYEKNYFIVVYGDKKHPEVLSLLDTIQNNALVINSIPDVEKITTKKKIGFISQTTKNIYDFFKLSSALLNRAEELRIFNTICKSTTERQKSVLELAKEVDVMLVIGGKESANTTRLAEIGKNQGVKTYHIETKNQLKYKWFYPEGKVGIVSGTSTPDWITNEIIDKLKEWYG
ncbi:4-hydroxy-3-methylbut-2-enyl diphosphate reductase [Candidatus Atribacteria bacterium RBG_19FT_COMBO_35_14]|uniref:4-hydroxy-3-methylbut-2-enyl diphosphate reductase n=1 Tax=Candidatus Sediminicultor quintus TaxID=1797291 RepID=A0A1F5A8R7_9BACT|nr:MAG: 4-hydroxy-3-methylbut-2-enyl diphosphate reductase [Candidatus Atribacteria bacterium RBG_19FT_COMBO_35_14]